MSGGNCFPHIGPCAKNNTETLGGLRAKQGQHLNVVTRHCYLGGSEGSKKLKGPEPTLGYQIPPWRFKAWRGRKRDQAIHREIL